MKYRAAVRVISATAWHLFLCVMPVFYVISLFGLSAVVIPGQLFVRYGIPLLLHILIWRSLHNRWSQMLLHSGESNDRIRDISITAYRSATFKTLQFGTAALLSVVGAAIGYRVVDEEKWLASALGVFCGFTSGVFVGGGVGYGWYLCSEFRRKCHE